MSGNLLKPARYIPYIPTAEQAADMHASDSGKDWQSKQTNFLLEIMKFLPSAEAQIYQDGKLTEEQRYEFSNHVFGDASDTESYGSVQASDFDDVVNTFKGSSALDTAKIMTDLKAITNHYVDTDGHVRQALYDLASSDDMVLAQTLACFSTITDDKKKAIKKAIYQVLKNAKNYSALDKPGEFGLTDRNGKGLPGAGAGKSFKNYEFNSSITNYNHTGTDENIHFYEPGSKVLQADLDPNPIAAAAIWNSLKSANYIDNHGNIQPKFTNLKNIKSFSLSGYSGANLKKIYNILRKAINNKNINTDVINIAAAGATNLLENAGVDDYTSFTADDYTQQMYAMNPTLLKGSHTLPTLADYSSYFGTAVSDFKGTSGLQDSHANPVYSYNDYQLKLPVADRKKNTEPSFYQIAMDPTAPWNDTTGHYSSLSWWTDKQAEYPNLAFDIEMMMTESMRRYFSAMTQLFGPHTQFNGVAGVNAGDGSLDTAMINLFSNWQNKWEKGTIAQSSLSDVNIWNAMIAMEYIDDKGTILFVPNNAESMNLQVGFDPAASDAEAFKLLKDSQYPTGGINKDLFKMFITAQTSLTSWLSLFTTGECLGGVNDVDKDRITKFRNWIKTNTQDLTDDSPLTPTINERKDLSHKIEDELFYKNDTTTQANFDLQPRNWSVKISQSDLPAVTGITSAQLKTNLTNNKYISSDGWVLDAFNKIKNSDDLNIGADKVKAANFTSNGFTVPESNNIIGILQTKGYISLFTDGSGYAILPKFIDLESVSDFNADFNISNTYSATQISAIFEIMKKINHDVKQEIYNLLKGMNLKQSYFVDTQLGILNDTAGDPFNADFLWTTLNSKGYMSTNGILKDAFNNLTSPASMDLGAYYDSIVTAADFASVGVNTSTLITRLKNAHYIWNNLHLQEAVKNFTSIADMNDPTFCSYYTSAQLSKIYTILQRHNANNKSKIFSIMKTAPLMYTANSWDYSRGNFISNVGRRRKGSDDNGRVMQSDFETADIVTNSTEYNDLLGDLSTYIGGDGSIKQAFNVLETADDIIATDPSHASPFNSLDASKKAEVFDIIKNGTKFYRDVNTYNADVKIANKTGLAGVIPYSSTPIDIDDLWNDLISNGYINDDGVVSDKFNDLTDSDDMSIDDTYDTQKNAIYTYLKGLNITFPLTLAPGYYEFGVNDDVENQPRSVSGQFGIIGTQNLRNNTMHISAFKKINDVNTINYFVQAMENLAYISNGVYKSALIGDLRKYVVAQRVGDHATSNTLLSSIYSAYLAAVQLTNPLVTSLTPEQEGDINYMFSKMSNLISKDIKMNYYDTGSDLRYSGTLRSDGDPDNLDPSNIYTGFPFSESWMVHDFASLQESDSLNMEVEYAFMWRIIARIGQSRYDRKMEEYNKQVDEQFEDEKAAARDEAKAREKRMMLLRGKRK